jgi:hypothetical protein
LLEIHSQHNKPSAFETVASELYSVSGGQGEVWQKAMALGRQLDPANPLFTEAGGSAFAATPAAAAAAAAAEPPASDTQCSRCRRSTKVELRWLRRRLFARRRFAGAQLGRRAQDAGGDTAGAAQEVAKSSRASDSSSVPGTVTGAAAAKSGARQVRATA